MWHAVRSLAREPRFTVPAILALALAIGATVSVFTVVHSVILEPLSFRHPGELVSVYSKRPDGAQYPFNIANFLELRESNRVMQDMAAFAGWNANLTGEANPERLPGLRVTGNLFEMLGVQAAAGRLLTPDDDLPGRPKTVVLTWQLWMRRYGGAPGIVGQTIRLNGEPHVVVGALPPSFILRNTSAEFAVPLVAGADPARELRTSTAFLRVVGRVQAGVSAERARSNLNAVAAELRQEHPEANQAIVGIEAVPLLADLTGASRPMLLTLLAAVGCVLMIACANISSLVIARSARRRRDAAIRAALGASRSRLARQWLAEGVLLAACGGVAGAVLAVWAVPMLLALSPAELPRAREVHVDGVALAVASGLALLCGLVLGGLPSLAPPPARLNERGVAGGRSHARAALVVGEVGLSLVLLTGALVAARSFQRAASRNPGFRVEDVLTFRLSLPAARYRTPRELAGFRDRLHERLAAIPGVMEAGAVSILPLSGPLGAADFTIEGYPPSKASEKPTADYRMIDSTYLAAMRIPILHGRGFTERDKEGNREVAIVSEQAVKLYWKGRDPVGSRILLEDNSGAARKVEVVGVAGGVHETGLEQPVSVCIYVPIPQIPLPLARFLTNNFFWAIRAQPGVNVARQSREAIQGLDSDVAAAESPMSRYVENSLAARRFSLRLLAAFALAAVLLAGGGLYALVSYTMAARTREIGIRVAMGAHPRQIAAMAVREAAVLAGAGAIIGTVCAWGLSRYAQALLFEIGPHDPAAMCGAGGVMIAVAAMASWIPARRAARVDPVQALRGE
jgi:putative ABC transport system permease protein